MAPHERTSGPDLSALLRRPQAMELFQAISLLERSVPGATRLGHDTGQGEGVRLCAEVTLAFTPSDVSEVSALPTGDDDAAGPRWLLRTPLMALAGVEGPLPLADSERLLQRARARDTAPLAFLDIFHHRWLSFLYRSRTQHRLGLQWSGAADSPLGRALDALGGLGLDRGARGPAGERAWLRQAALQGLAPRSMAGLTTLLSDRLGVPVRGRSFTGGWLTLSTTDTPRLGRGAALGSSAVLGRRAWDASSGITLQAGPLRPEQWSDWLPGGTQWGRLRWLASRHVQRDLQLCLQLQPVALPASARPGLGRARLSWSSWLTGRARALAPGPVLLRLPSTGQAEA